MRSRFKVCCSQRTTCSELMDSIVLLQAMREDPAPDAKCRDKFLVQSIAITPERDIGNIATIVPLSCKSSPSFANVFQWQNVEKAGRDAIEEKKIRVVFLASQGTATTPNHKQVNGLVCLTLQ